MEKLNGGLKVGTRKKISATRQGGKRETQPKKSKLVPVPVFMKLYQVPKKIPERKMAKTWPVV